ncbi:hypothetical protein [Chitinophaga sp. MD30]|nr:hypothetical protein [Chitinophaga sp. MD30]
MKRFIRDLGQKLLLKQHRFPGQISLDGYNTVKTFRQFDDRYTAPLHGFPDAEEYWRLSSAKPHLAQIRIPTLLINALDDPFLGPGSFPYEIARQNPHLFLETPHYGGHVGFVNFRDTDYWSEKRAFRFIQEQQ